MRRTSKWQRKKNRPLHHGQTTVGRRGPAAPTRSPQATWGQNVPIDGLGLQVPATGRNSLLIQLSPPPLRQSPESRQRIERDIENVSVLTQIQKRASQQLSGMIFFIIDPQALALGVDSCLGLERQNVTLLG